jgi:hypothetical protein
VFVHADDIKTHEKSFEESEHFFILFLKKMENLRWFFSIFEVRGGNLFLNVV